MIKRIRSSSRKKPIRHKVRSHERKGKQVKEHYRGQGVPRFRKVKVKFRTNPKILDAFKLIKGRVGWVDNVKIIEQKDIKGRLVSPQGWDVTGLRVHGYSKEWNAIIVPDNPDTHEVIHEYGHYLFDKYPMLESVNVPATYPIETREGKAEIYNVFYGNNDEWFAYHFPFWIEKKTQNWHPVEKKLFREMIGKIN